MSKLKLELNVDRFELGALMSKHKLELNVDTFEHGGINVPQPPSGLGKGIGQVRLG